MGKSMPLECFAGGFHCFILTIVERHEKINVFDFFNQERLIL